MIKRLLYILCVLSTTIYCHKQEVVESKYQLPTAPKLSYKFARNGENNVNNYKCELTPLPFDRLYTSYIKTASIGTDIVYNTALQLFKEGENGIQPYNIIATSNAVKNNRQHILQDYLLWIETSAVLSGKGTAEPYETRRTEATIGQKGYVGINIGDKDICFVNEKGLAVAEVFKFATIGSVYLDKIFNIHLNDSIIRNPKLYTDQEQVQLLPGHNYTALEHNWDMAYGYYNQIKHLAKADGIPAIKNCDKEIFDCFVRGRMNMDKAHFAEMAMQADTIKQNLTKVLCVRAMGSLCNPNVTANLEEDAKRAFKMLSQSYGLIYSLQFIGKDNKTMLWSQDEINALLNSMLYGNGFWDKDRLLSNEKTIGSLKEVATKIGNKIGISLQEIEK